MLLIARQLYTHELTEQATEPLPPFCEESFVSDDFAGAHAGLPNLGILKATFDCVSRTLPADKATKLSGLGCVSDK